jgi:hypothetical protein
MQSSTESHAQDQEHASASANPIGKSQHNTSSLPNVILGQEELQRKLALAEEAKKLARLNEDLNKKNEMLIEMVKKRDAAFANLNAKDYKVLESVLLPYKENADEPDDKYLEGLGFKSYYTDMEQSSKASILTKMATELKEAREFKKQIEAQQKSQQKQQAPGAPPQKPQQSIAAKPHMFDQYAPISQSTQENRGLKRPREAPLSSSAYQSNFTSMAAPQTEIGVGASRFQDDEETESHQEKYRRLSEELIEAINRAPNMPVTVGYIHRNS